MKAGFFWYLNGAPATGGEQAPATQPWWLPQALHLESITVFLGATPIQAGQTMDLNVLIYHTSGQLIVPCWADRYANTAGITDVTYDRVFRTPWIFQQNEGIVVKPYALGPAGARWGIAIHVDGYLDGPPMMAGTARHAKQVPHLVPPRTTFTPTQLWQYLHERNDAPAH